MWPLEWATGKEVQGGGQYRENMLISLGVRALQRAEKGLKKFCRGCKFDTKRENRYTAET